MSILNRFKTIMSAKVNKALDSMENPAEIVDEKIRKTEQDLDQWRSETAAVMANAELAKEKVEDCEKEIEKYNRSAKIAASKGNDADAKVFLEKVISKERELERLKGSYEAAKENAERMEELHVKLEKDLASYKGMRNEIKATESQAKMMKQRNDIEATFSGIGEDGETINRMKEKADRMLATENARAKLLNKPADDAEELAKKYEESGESNTIDERLAALKAELNSEE